MLKSKRLNALGRGPSKSNSGSSYGPCEIRIFRKESVTWDYSVYIILFRDIYYLIPVQYDISASWGNAEDNITNPSRYALDGGPERRTALSAK